MRRSLLSVFISPTQFDVVKNSHAASGEHVCNGSDTWVTTSEGEMLILEMARADLTENKDKRSHLKTTQSIQHKVIQNSMKTDMSSMLKQIPQMQTGCSIRTSHNFTTTSWIAWTKSSLEKTSSSYLKSTAALDLPRHLSVSSLLTTSTSPPRPRTSLPLARS